MVVLHFAIVEGNVLVVLPDVVTGPLDALLQLGDVSVEHDEGRSDGFECDHELGLSFQPFLIVGLVPNLVSGVKFFDFFFEASSVFVDVVSLAEIIVAVLISVSARAVGELWLLVDMLMMVLIFGLVIFRMLVV